PAPGEQLTLQVDLAGVGIGAVLLAHLMGAYEDARPVAFFSKGFTSAQGKRHAGFRKAWGLVHAVEHFYMYLDGCVNLSIKVDATTALGLFGHKDTCPLDKLANLCQQLTALGMHQRMMRHHVGETHLAADWLSRTKECICEMKKKSLTEPAAVMVMAVTLGTIEEVSEWEKEATSDAEEAEELEGEGAASEDDGEEQPLVDRAPPAGEDTLRCTLGKTLLVEITEELQQSDDACQRLHALCVQ
ncbi:hypothetical protein GGI24_003178, partial [Coemansia furcata]